jgi:hypothetical protein
MNDVQQVDATISRLLDSDTGRVKIAASMVQPLRVRLDHGAIHNLLDMVSSDTEPGDGAIPFEWSDTFTLEVLPGRELRMFDRLLDTIRVAALEYINRTVIAFVDSVVKEPSELENWHHGSMVMNAWSYAVGPHNWPDFESEGQRDMLKYGRFGLWKDMTVRCTRHVEDGRVYRFGPNGTVGEVVLAIDIIFNVAQSTGLNYVVDAKLTGFIQPVDAPQVAVTIVHKPATIAN